MLLLICFILIHMVTLINSQSTLGLGKGAVCKGRGKNAWKCKLTLDCPQIGDFKKKNHSICNFEGIDPIICCPPPSRNFNKRKQNKNSRKNRNKALKIVSNGNAKIKCLLYNRNHCGNYLRVRRSIWRSIPVVVGGRTAKPKEHKAMVVIGYGSAISKSWDCGGSLIAERWVLSAAHCAQSQTQGPARWARVGDLDISSTNEDARPQEKIIMDRIIHPNYKEPAVYNDIALFKLNSDVLFNDWVAPICLHTETNINAPKAIVTGWGRLDFAGDVSAKLQEVQITLVNGSECKRLYSSSHDRKIPRGINIESMICAGEKEGGKDACSGDSGGPLVIEVLGNCLKTQIGITSFGKECGLPNTPGVYTMVSHFIPWIESIVWPN
ncbi:venom protease-like [Rhodnius prolixus]|uniref:venom protease-like n=1 Tax=Rhodnius prolixus TaxID=13249 RepID=UPI003D18F0C9